MTIKFARHLIAAALCALGSAHAANVAYIGNCSSGGYLSAYGHTVTQITNPVSAGFLAGFDAAVVSSNCSFSNPTLIGDELKNFADAGGGVVLGQFSFQGVWSLAGGIMGSAYNPFIVDPSSSGYAFSSNLGTVYDAGSSLFAGVSMAGLTTQFQADVGLNAGAQLVADWDSGRHAIAYQSLSSSTVVGLNLFPDENYINADGQRLVANAINFSLDAQNGGGNVPEPTGLALIGVALVGAGLARRRRAA